MTFALPLDTAPMEARSATKLPRDPGWRFEPKWDGFRCLAFCDGETVELRAKSGKPLGRYFPEMVDALRAVGAHGLVLDGELTVPIDGVLSFDALQARVHPAASRIARLARETPSQLILFDCLATQRDGVLLDAPLHRRRAVLETVFKTLKPASRFRLSPSTTDGAEAQAWLDRSHGDVDGVVAKRDDGAYVPGERAMLKIKHLRTADCVVGGFRYASDSREVGSLLLGLYNDAGKLDHVGYTSALSAEERAVLTPALQKLIEPPGFSGDSPGGPSRWSNARSAEWQPLRPALVVEVRYDHVSGGRFRHGTRLLRWRTDKSPQQCRSGQLEQPKPP